ncbi:SDR family oxidoreductase [Saccharothrix obliqua]|uniref:SDR family oxidoreductase n=1 Tax=Saccharothrix obliqua TaxID=2861747 RepID=UPI001C5FED27|nr:SDR family oxidoreductase [Saccharothrix obliqua]MBW4718794.1 SDR family oxidoreductase [Saccharothrix obliqua]
MDRTAVAVVTGGASGIGHAVVADLAAHGYHVVVLDREHPTGQPPDGVLAVTGDVRVAADNQRAVDAALSRFGRLDLFVGNAGVHDAGTGVRDLPAADLADLTRHVLDVDVVGYLLGAAAAAGPLADRGGSMVFTLSDASFVVRGNGTGIAYAAAKHAALGLVRHLAADLAPAVRVNAVAPGGVVTGLRDARGTLVYDRPVEISEHIRAANPLGLVLAPDEIAPLYRFLASPHAKGMTGEVLRPDGGLAVR